MSRNKGTFNFSANFEPLIKAPLDARAVVGSYTDLIDPSTWADGDGNIWLYKGAIVSVADDPSSGIYFLSDENNYTDYNYWIPAGSNTQVDSSLSLVNVGGGDVSIYAGIMGTDQAGIRELKAGSGITLSYDDPNTILIDVSGGGSGSGVNGGVWITDITPTSSGNVGNKVYSSDGVVLDSCLTDTNNVTVEVLAIPGNTNYKPVITIGASLNTVSMSAETDKPLFTGSISLDLNDVSSLTVFHEDGAEHKTEISYETAPVILGATFVNGYPAGQTELKAGDTFDVSIVTDSNVDLIEIQNSDAFVFSSQGVASGTSHVITGTIANRGTSTQALPFSVRVRKPTGSWSTIFTSDTVGTTDGVYRVNLNNTYPSISIGSVSYPASQEAIKSSESAIVVNNISNFDTVSYSSPNGQLTISNPNSWEINKNVSYLSGSYNVSVDNFRIVANRAANDATSTSNDTL
jgi:hypothetical protein